MSKIDSHFKITNTNLFNNLSFYGSGKNSDKETKDC